MCTRLPLEKLVLGWVKECKNLLKNLLKHFIIHFKFLLKVGFEEQATLEADFTPQGPYNSQITFSRKFRPFDAIYTIHTIWIVCELD